jgi:DsbC/DsbD-like thiol-disulfide interchange protein
MPPGIVQQNGVQYLTLHSSSSHRVSSHFLALALALFFVTRARAQAQPPPAAHVQLIWDGNPIRPGHTLWVGVLFQLDPGWHIYWQNPGDSGEPPKIQWKLPPDFHGGAFLWPRPILLGKAPVRDYGYAGRVLLMTPLQTPPSLPDTSPVALVASVGYIVCREICIPGKADLTLSIPQLGQTTGQPSPWRKLFQETRAQLPHPLPPQLKVRATQTSENIVLIFEGAAAPEEIRFFPLKPGVIENAAPQELSSIGKVMRLMLKKSEQLTKPVSALKGVIVLDEDRAYEISVPVKSS